MTSVGEQQLVELKWRLDVPIASRECPRPTMPANPQYIVTISTNNTATSHGNAAASAIAAKNNASCNASGVVSLASGAVAANCPSAAGGGDSTRWASMDVETAINVSKGLEDALNSLWSSGYRRINKQVK